MHAATLVFSDVTYHPLSHHHRRAAHNAEPGAASAEAEAAPQSEAGTATAAAAAAQQKQGSEALAAELNR
jgi:hypothetical protein